MSVLLDYEIPVLHPFAVHFPVGLLAAALVAGLVWAVRGDRSWLRATSFIQALGTAGAAFAYVTGEAMLEHSEGSPVVEELAGLHEQLALATLLIAAVGLIALLSALRVTRSDARLIRGRYRLALFVALLAGVIACLSAAHVGGAMVWGVAG